MAIARLNAQTRHSQQARKSLGTRLLMDVTFKHRWIQVTVTVDELAEVCNEYSHNCVLLLKCTRRRTFLILACMRQCFRSSTEYFGEATCDRADSS